MGTAVARRVELWDDALVLPPALAARATVLVLGDELLGLKLSGPGKSAAPLEPQLGVQAPGGAGGCQVHCALV